jgi:uncharacterized protein
VNETLSIPLFPLNTVLFPGGMLPLRIFEQRYMDMAKDCLRNDAPFGVCLIKQGKEVGAPADPHAVGCLARIKDWEMPQLGILHVQTIGEGRFAIEHWQAKANGLLVGSVHLLPNEPARVLAPEYAACAAVLRMIAEAADSPLSQATLRLDDADWVSYRLAELLPLDPRTKQRLLEMGEASNRLAVVKQFLDEQGLLSP